MANALFPSFKEALLSQNPSIDLDADTIKVALVASSYSYSSAHNFYDDISASVVGTPATLGSKTVTGGVFDAADASFTAVSGSEVGALIIYKDTGSAGTSPLIAFIDTVTSGLPVTPNGGDIDITFNASGIFAL